MNIRTSAVYRNGILQPAKSLPLAENQRVDLTIADPATRESISFDEFLHLATEFAFDNSSPGLPRDFSRDDIYLDRD